LFAFVVALCAAQQRFGGASAASDRAELPSSDADGNGDDGGDLVLPSRPSAPVISLTPAVTVVFERQAAVVPSKVSARIFRPPISDLA
jgi:hypothetical protein